LAKARAWTDYKRRRELIERTITRVSYADGNYTVEGRIILAPDPTKSGVQNTYRCIRSDSESHDDHGERGESGAAAEHAEGVSQVDRQIGEPRTAALIAHRLSGLRHSAVLEPRHAAGFILRIWGHRAARPHLLRGQLQMSAQFFFYFAISSAPPQRSPETEQPFAQPWHVSSQSACISPEVAHNGTPRRLLAFYQGAAAS
jgi:hypothetical protein